MFKSKIDTYALGMGVMMIRQAYQLAVVIKAL